jgi:hypothetical protein
MVVKGPRQMLSAAKRVMVKALPSWGDAAAFGKAFVVVLGFPALGCFMACIWYVLTDPKSSTQATDAPRTFKWVTHRWSSDTS